MIDFAGQELREGDTIAWASSQSTDMIRGTITKISDKMVIVYRGPGFWPPVVKRFPQQVIRIDTPLC